MLLKSLLITILAILTGYYGLMLPINESVKFSLGIALMYILTNILIIIIFKKPVKNIFLPQWKTFIKNNVKLVLILIAIFLLKLTWTGIFYTSGNSIIKNEEESDILTRRSFLISKVATKDFNENMMPVVLPSVYKKEWAIGTLSMTSAALTNIAFDFPQTKDDSKDAIKTMIEKALDKDLRSYEEYHWGEDAIDTLSGNNGHIGYLAHLNWMFGAYRLVGGSKEYDKLHKDITEAIVRRISSSKSLYIETFPSEIYVPDNTCAIASIVFYDMINGNNHKEFIQKWLTYNKNNNIDKNGLLYPWVDFDGKGYGEPRGSYSAWNLMFLPHIDEEFARKQYEVFKKTFVANLPLGGNAIREYPEGVRGNGDIDSGPVVFGLSSSGTCFAISGAKYFKDGDLLDGLLRFGEFAGSSFEFGGERHYLIAPLMADAVMLNVKTSRPWDTRYLIN